MLMTVATHQTLEAISIIISLLLKAMLSLFTSCLTTVGDVVQLPSQLINTLSTITAYGSWIVGTDLLLILCACVTFWTTSKIVIGLFAYIWDLVPFT